MDWSAWHEQYDLADSWLARRLQTVQARIDTALSEAPEGELKVISLCAGEGRDLLPVLARHPRRDDVRARLVELDPRNVAAARERAEAAGLRHVEVVAGDAGLVDQYEGMAPADLVLICGVFGNITDRAIEGTVAACTQLCRTGATVVWTRHRGAPDLVPQICAWFEARDFERRWLSPADVTFGVGAHRFAGTPSPLRHGARLFEFVGYDVLAKAAAEPHGSEGTDRGEAS
jgi:hypothetical protein